MARPASKGLTERESQLMEILWENGPLTAESVRGNLPDQPHDSTVRNLLRILTNKRICSGIWETAVNLRSGGFARGRTIAGDPKLADDVVWRVNRSFGHVFD
jgi:hypothetical protein